MISFSISKNLKAGHKPLHINISINMKKGSIITLFGESGVGKTSILRMLSGLMKPDAGEISINERIVFSSDRKINLLPQKGE